MENNKTDEKTLTSSEAWKTVKEALDIPFMSHAASHKLMDSIDVLENHRKPPTHEVKIYFSSFLSINVNAKDDDEAIAAARKKAQFTVQTSPQQLAINAEPSEQCDEAEPITD